MSVNPAMAGLKDLSNDLLRKDANGNPALAPRPLEEKALLLAEAVIEVASMPEYVGIIVKDGKVADLMRHMSQDESENNLSDSPDCAGASSITCWEVVGDDVRLVKDLTAELLG